MADDPGDLLADKVAELLNAASLSFPFKATVPDDPGREINVDGTAEFPQGLKVFVVPVASTETKLDDAAVEETVTLNVFVSNLLDINQNITRRTMGGFTRQVQETIRQEDFAIDGFQGDWEWSGGEVVTKYDADQLTTKKRFLSVLSATYYNVV